MTISKLNATASFLFALFLAVPFVASRAHAQGTHAKTVSAITHFADVGSFGKIGYRPPLAGNSGPVVVLVQGVFGGSTHRQLREVRDLLDQQGAQVYTMDLPGTGESNSPKVIYDMTLLKQFILSFIDEIVQRPTILVAEQIAALAAMEAAKDRPGMVRKLVLLSPTGMLYLNQPPNEKQNAFFEKLWSDPTEALNFHLSIVSESSARYYLSKAYFDPAQVTDERVLEITETAANTEQRWITANFIGGKFFLDFTVAAQNVPVPTVCIFGEHPTAPVSSGQPETWDLFQKSQPLFKYVVVKNSANLPHREHPDEVVAEILAP